MAKLTAKCPDCRSVIEFMAMPRLDQTVVCENCEATLTVVNLNPIELDWAFDEESEEYEDYEDFDYDEDYEDYDDEDEDDYDDDYDE
ncbi:MAG: hypothetical protein H6667_08310 [Ardenticatenaceae bacterium]|nr:hypothetical protein [Ardenticatenaceae bacterium]